MNQPLLRSVLYMPASNQRAMDKARTLPCDAVILDLEDSVAAAAKEPAREQVLRQLQDGGYGNRQVVVRANGIDTPWGEADLLALAGAGAGTVCLPKVEGVGQLQRCRDLLHGAVASVPGAAGPKLWAMIETPHGVHQVEQICGGEPAIEALVMGTTDLAHELRVPVGRDRLGLQYALSRAVNAARMAGVLALDSVFLNLQDPAALRRDCEYGRALGFDGKTLIHPSQIDVANEVFSPSEQQIAWARRALAAWQAAQDEGKGVALVDGTLMEIMHRDQASRILALAEQQES